MYCSNCGKEIVDDSASYCSQCGAQINIGRQSSESTNSTRTAVEKNIDKREEFFDYKRSRQQYSSRSCLLVFLCFIEAVFLIFSIVAVIAAPPLGIIMLVGCFFFLKLIIKQGKKCRKIWKDIKAYLNENRQTLNIEGDTTYCFVAPFSTKDTISKIVAVLSKIGDVKNVDSLHCIVFGRLQVDLKKMQKITFYVENNESECKVRAVFKKMANDAWWDFFLHELFASSPGIDFGVSIANGTPKLSAVLDLSDETRQVSFSKTTGGRSLGGFLVGGALFGSAGAVVGGLSGKQRTVTRTNTIYSNTLLVRIIYSNGRLWEGTVRKGSNLYNEIMVNM